MHANQSLKFKKKNNKKILRLVTIIRHPSARNTRLLQQKQMKGTEQQEALIIVYFYSPRTVCTQIKRQKSRNISHHCELLEASHNQDTLFTVCRAWMCSVPVHMSDSGPPTPAVCACAAMTTVGVLAYIFLTLAWNWNYLKPIIFFSFLCDNRYKVEGRKDAFVEAIKLSVVQTDNKMSGHVVRLLASYKWLLTGGFFRKVTNLALIASRMWISKIQGFGLLGLLKTWVT